MNDTEAQRLAGEVLEVALYGAPNPYSAISIGHTLLNSVGQEKTQRRVKELEDALGELLEGLRMLPEGAFWHLPMTLQEKIAKGWVAAESVMSNQERRKPR